MGQAEAPHDGGSARFALLTHTPSSTAFYDQAFAQCFRERKKMENAELQNAVNLLTAQVAAMKVLEARGWHA